jgi:hypothetical protein
VDCGNILHAVVWVVHQGLLNGSTPHEIPGVDMEITLSMILSAGGILIWYDDFVFTLLVILSPNDE